MLGDDLTPFLNTKEFARDVRFTSSEDFADLRGIFDDEGSEVNNIVIETARFISTQSNVDKGWECEINAKQYRVLFKREDLGNYCEYFMRDITGQASRDIS